VEPSPPKRRGRPPKDPFKALMQKEGISFPESVMKLAMEVKPRKIALVGAFPPHWQQAPYSDPSWEIWAMSAGMWKKHPRWDRWFELHAEKTYPRYDRIATQFGNKGYIDFIKENATTCKDFPYKELIEEFGPYFFTTGQIPWMLAYAITQKPDIIGIWGVEAWGEYTPQRKDVHHFIQVARDRGIKIEVPENTTLLAKPKLYAFGA
jgi:hypothetical protein